MVNLITKDTTGKNVCFRLLIAYFETVLFSNCGLWANFDFYL